MTCIAGIAEGGTVWLAGDSAGCSGWDLTIRADPKVFTNGPYVMGYTSSYRMGQLLQYKLKLPDPSGDHLHRFMCTTFADAVRDCLTEGGWTKKKEDREEGGQFLVGVWGQLFIIDSDFSVGVPADPYAAVGCGEQIAHGVLFATAENKMMLPQERLELAVRAAERFSNGVRLPAVFAQVSA